jgi:tetratricopeptide (TPR) repeat protein
MTNDDETEKYSADYPQEYITLMKEGNKLFKLDKFEEAMSCYEKAREILPDKMAPYNGLGKCYRVLKDLDKAQDLLEKAISLVPDNYKPYNNLGLVYRDRGNTEKALELYNKSIELNIEYFGAYNNIANLYLDDKDYNTAIDYYLKSLFYKPDQFCADNAYNQIGKCYSKLKNSCEAIDYFLKAIETNPKFAVAYYNAGREFYILKNYEKSIEFYKKAVEFAKSKDDRLLYILSLGYSYFYAGNYKYALICFEECMEANPDDREVAGFAAFCNLRLKNYKQAIYYYEKYLDHDKKAWVYNDIGLAYFYMGDMKQAEDNFRKALDLDPNYEKAKINLANLSAEND